MIIDNGTQARLIIEGVHDGLCGVQSGVISFKPNLRVKKPETARGALLAGDPIRITVRKSADNPGFYLADFEGFV